MVKRRRERYAFHWLDMLPAKMYFIYNFAIGENTHSGEAVVMPPTVAIKSQY
jgi:hypothetical protein